MSYSKLDQNQIIQRVYDETNDRLKVDAEVTATIGTVECVIDAASGDNIMIVGTEDGTTSGTQHVLEIGSDKKAKVIDDSANTTLSSIDSKLSTNIFSLSKIDLDLLNFQAAVTNNKVQFDTLQTISSGTSLSSNFNTSAVDTQKYSEGNVIANWTGVTGSTSTIVLEISSDNSTWSQIGESGIALTVSADVQMWQFTTFCARYFRAAYTNNTNSTGSVTITFMGKY